MKIIECPRDAMQGLPGFIPTADKVRYLNSLLKVGFDILDCGSFVSAKAIPQMRDTGEVLKHLDVTDCQTTLLTIVANTRGAIEASQFDQVSSLGFPLSISETFQLRNTNKTIAEALNSLNEIKDICVQRNKTLVTYISMGFGNPYGDPYDVTMVSKFVEILLALGTDVISLADTIGAATPGDVRSLFSALRTQYPTLELGVHLHSTPATTIDKLSAAYEAGCNRFDGALMGFGGCPMAKDDLVGNMATERILTFLKERGETLHINEEALSNAMSIAGEIFPLH
jgi:hydroxymethylglutaryl-CoA lyase